MSTMTANPFTTARERQLDKMSDKALDKARKRGDSIAVITATGTKELQGLLSRGWTLIGQDMSEAGQWIRRFNLQKKVLGRP